MLGSGFVAFFISRLQFTTRRCPLVVNSARNAFADSAFKRMTTWRRLIGACHATIERIYFFSEPVRQARCSRLSPIKRYSESGAAGTAIQAWVNYF
jgi:hypothetical protein